MASTSTVLLRPDCTFSGGNPVGSARSVHATGRIHWNSVQITLKDAHRRRLPWQNLRRFLVAPRAGFRADDSAPFDMSLENALKVLGISEGASFEDIVRAKNSILAACKDDSETIDKVEAAYDTLLMQSLSQRRAGKVVSNTVRFADVKPVTAAGIGSMPLWLQNTVRKSPVSFDTPSANELSLEVGVYGALMFLSYINGSSTSSTAPYDGFDVPGLILASSFGASLYFMIKKNVKFGKAMVVTIGGLVAGAVIGSAVENWLQVDIVPFLGVHSPTTVVSEVILLSQLLVSLYLR